MKLNRIMCLLGIFMFFSTMALGEVALKADDEKIYNRLMTAVDEGDIGLFSKMLLDGSVSQELYGFLLAEDEQLIRSVVTDAMIRYSQAGDIYSLAALRLGGYASDGCFEDYWELLGSVLPASVEESEEIPEIDSYLLHELCEAYRRSDYAVRGFIELRSAGMLDDEMHAELLEALGFDYTDEVYLDANGIAPLRILTLEEKAVYDEVLLFIDDGDCMSVAKMLFSGEVTPNVYTCLMQQNSDIMDFVAAQALAEITSGRELKEIVRLRVLGYISDQCFEYYWEFLGASAIDPDGEELPGVDRYLVHELVRIRAEEENGVAIVQEIWQSGMLSDETYAALDM